VELLMHQSEFGEVPSAFYPDRDTGIWLRGSTGAPHQWIPCCATTFGCGDD
jgi:hypothetical protein